MDTTSDCTCPPRATTRRTLLRGTALAGGTLAFGSTIVTMGTASAATSTTPSVLVVLSLRGAADGLSLVVPHADPAYYAARKTIAVPADRLVAKDGFFGMHPALAPLLPLWSAGKLAAVHATGLPVANRSHFLAMEELEDADPGSSTRVGWLNRLIGAQPGGSALEGVALGYSIPTALQGPEPVMSFPDVDAVRIAGADGNVTRVRSLTTQWSRAATPMGVGFRAALGSVAGLAPAKKQPDNYARYPQVPLGDALASVARTLRADVGVSTVTVDSGNWDMHTGVGATDAGWMQRNAAELAGCIAAFFTDLGPVADRVTLVTISEFGRRVQENANGGLDHGWGNVMLLAGAGVKGGRYYGRWPGLRNTLDADLAVTTDYRSVLAEVVASRTSASTAAVFPGFQREHVGVMLGQ